VKKQCGCGSSREKHNERHYLSKAIKDFMIVQVYKGARGGVVG
jgi:hypothetical protein